MAASAPSKFLNIARGAIFDDAYEVMDAIGRGRHSVVYRARAIDVAAEENDAVVALKILTGHSHHPEENIARMKREAVAMLSSRHRNVVKLYDFVSTNELCYLSMEFAARGDIRSKLEERDSAFDSNIALRIILQTLLGLEAVHRAGIIHRDIKPDNLLVTDSGIVKIADFGIAYLPTEKSSLEDAAAGVGTFDYLAPECIENRPLGFGSDVYSAGVTLYELLTNHLPYEGSSIADKINSKISGKHLPLREYIPDVPLILEQLVENALARDTAKRFQSAREFRRAVAVTMTQLSRDYDLADNVVFFDTPSPVNKEATAVETQEQAIADSEELAAESSDEVIPTTDRKVSERFRSRLYMLSLWALPIVLTFIYILTFHLGFNSTRHVPQQPSVTPLPQSPLFIPEKPIVESTASPVSKKHFLGTLHDLEINGQDLRFWFEFSEEMQSVIFRPELDDALPASIPRSYLLAGSEFIIRGNNYHLAMSVEKMENPPLGLPLFGRYEDKISGKRGRWTLKRN